jgi:hypothetical protein
MLNPLWGTIGVIIPFDEEVEINLPGNYPSIENPWYYKGWYVWKWTGWKGSWGRKNPRWDGGLLRCQSCGKVIENWDILYVSQSISGYWHAECAQDEAYFGADGKIFGQWLAMSEFPVNLDKKIDNRFLYGSAPGPAGEYKRGQLFDISSTTDLTYYTPLEVLEEERYAALERLHTLIDYEVMKHAHL